MLKYMEKRIGENLFKHDFSLRLLKVILANAFSRLIAKKCETIGFWAAQKIILKCLISETSTNKCLRPARFAYILHYF